MLRRRLNTMRQEFVNWLDDGNTALTDALLLRHGERFELDFT